MERKLGLGLTDIHVEMVIREERARGASGLENAFQSHQREPGLQCSGREHREKCGG